MPAALTLAPTITVGGQPLATKWQDALLECKVDLEYNAPGQVTLRFSDPGYGLTQDPTLALATEVDVGVPQAGTLVNAEVTAIGVEQCPGEGPELVVTAMDKAHRLGRGSKVATYLNVTYSDIVSQLAASHGLSASTDPTEGTMEYVMQVSSDLTFLNDLASRAGFYWWAAGRTLHFKKPAAGATVELKLGGQLRSFSVLASGHAPGSTEVYGWDRDNQQKLTGTASRTTLSARSELADKVSSPDRAFGTAKLVTAGLAGHNADEVQALSQALMDWANATTLRAVGLAEVEAGIKLGASVKVTDAGPLSGSYPVSRVEHTYRPGRGFLTRFWSGGQGQPDGAGRYPPLQGPTTYHPGLVVGQVTNVNDSDKRAGRVKVRYPGLDEQQESAWARVLQPGAGKDMGMVVLPEVGDEVLVGFEHGDPRQPVVLGGLYGAKSTIPKWPVQEGKVTSRLFTSRLGHVLELSDGDSSADQYFMVQLAGKEHTMKISKQETTLEIPSGQALTVKAGTTQVELSTSGDVTIKGNNINIQAQQNVKIEGLQVNVSAQAQLQMQGQGQASLKGAMLELEGEGQASLKGAIVQIN